MLLSHGVLFTPIPLVSVLVPLYNAARWLSETLTCVQQQTWPNIETIIVDDGSTDESLGIAKQFAGPRIKVIAQKNAGGSVARQRALEEAQGDFIQYLDADDLLSPEKIERQVRALQVGEPNRIASCCWARFFTPTPEGAAGVREPLWSDFAPLDCVVTSALGGGMMPIHAWLTPRAVVERAGRWPSYRAVHQDGEYFNRVILASRGITFVDDVWAYYRSGVGGWSGTRSTVAMSGMYRVTESMTAALLAREDSARTRLAAATLFQRFVHDVYPDEPDLVRMAELRIAALGGANLEAHGGPIFRAARRLVGWKLARRLQRSTARMRQVALRQAALAA